MGYWLDSEVTLEEYIFKLFERGEFRSPEIKKLCDVYPGVAKMRDLYKKWKSQKEETKGDQS